MGRGRQQAQKCGFVRVCVIIVKVVEDDLTEVSALEAADDERSGEAGRVRLMEAKSDV
jgi:hypothetical protein